MQQKLADLINLIFGFRKFFIILALYVMAIVFRIKGFISGSEMVDLLKEATVVFLGANTAEHLINVAKDYVATKASPEAAPSEPSPSSQNMAPAVNEAEEAKTEEQAKQ